MSSRSLVSSPSFRRRVFLLLGALIALTLIGLTSVSATAVESEEEFTFDDIEHTYEPIEFEDAESDHFTSYQHDPIAFLELHADLDLEDPSQAQHLESLLALQDKYTTTQTPQSVAVVVEETMPEPAPAHVAAAASVVSPLEDPNSLVETEQYSTANTNVGLSVGASAEVEAAIAAGVDMSSESQMEAQLESLAAAQQSTEKAASESQQAEQTKDLLSFFWGKTPHKVWREKAAWNKKTDGYVHPHKAEYLNQHPSPAEVAPPSPATRAGRAPPPPKPANKSVKKTPAFEEFQRNTINGRPRYIHRPGKTVAPTAPANQPTKSIKPPEIGQREVFWLSLGKLRFSWNNVPGASYAFNSLGDAKSACQSVGATLATRAQLKAAHAAGAEWCACGAVAEGTWGFPMQRRVSGCGTGIGTNEICSSGGATCYGYKPSKASLSKLPTLNVAPFKPNQWYQDPFAGLNEKCMHGAPWKTKSCLAAAWKIAGCSRRGTRFPSTQASTVLWNQMSSWPAVIADMRRIAENDVPGGTTTNQCKGPREVFFFATGPNRFIWNGQTGNGYPFNTKSAAEAACASIGSTLATKSQLESAWKDGAEWCMCGALADDDRWSFPMHRVLAGCGSQKGVIRTCKAGGATCYGVKPSESKVKGIAPFKPGQYHQDRWTPLVKTCSHEPPYSLSKCVRPAWKLAGCTKLGKDYPHRGAPILAEWNRMSWDSVRADILNRARNDPASCQSKYAVLDGACNHPPPYSTKRCLQQALTLAGCDKTGFIWPAVSTRGAKANVWWNRQKWSTVVEDMQAWATLDLHEKKSSHLGGCRGLKETFWYSGTATASYQFVNSKEAASACEKIGAVLATKEQVDEAYKLGAEWCAAGFTTDGEARYPIQTPRKGCSSKAGVAVWSKATKGGATCFGYKPNPTQVTGILPFNPKTRFSAVREWKVTPIDKCTKQCGGGIQTRKVRCVDSVSGAVRPDHTCASLGPKPLKKAPCNVTPCSYDWKKSSWSDCTATCGGGVQTRTIRCLQTTTGNEFPHEKCLKLDEPRPRIHRECNQQPCISYQWKIGIWSTCSKTCEGGSQDRLVKCLGSDGKIHSDERCQVNGSKKPLGTQTCNTHVCPKYAWKKHPWETCSLSCGGGKSTRRVECMGTDGSVSQDSKCLNLPSLGARPMTEKACNTQECLLYTWARGAWSACSRSCGGGSSTRSVTCQDSLNATVADGACALTGPKPRAEKACATIPCGNFNWFPHKWSDCSTSCGGGFQTRQVDCVGENGQLATDAQCVNAGSKKDTKQPCNTKPCVILNWVQKKSPELAPTMESLPASVTAPVNITEAEGWSACSAKCGGGFQTREFECKANDGSSRDASACEVVVGPLPKSRQSCNTDPCVTYDFLPSPWSDCSLSCGGGLKTRSTPCIGSNGIRVPGKVCLSTGLTRPSKQKSCNTKPCEGYTWTVGPYSRCDASCGGGLQTRKVVCSSSSGKVHDDRHCGQVGYDKPEAARSCNSHRCVEKKWRIGTWDSCDRSCGGGETHRSVACFGTDGKSYSDQDCLDSYRQQNASLTQSQNIKPSSKMSCNTNPCSSYFWEVADWEKCQARCGGGLQTRRVVCMSTDGTEKADALCSALASKPLGQQTCNEQPCPSYKLELGAWETCSSSCGTGTQNRTVTCISSKGVVITDPTKIAEVCPAPPDLEQQCNTQPCTNNDERGWVVKEWSACDSKCGGGVQQRLVQCVSQVDKTCATFGDKPVAERACNTRGCTVYEWDKSDWSACSVSCGKKGVQRRVVTCKGTDGSINNPFESCKDAGTQPSATKPCNQSPCVSYFWKASEWSACSRACATKSGEGGIATREVVCQGSDGAKRNEEACATQGAKPETTKACNTAACENYEFKIGAWESCSRGCSTDTNIGSQTRSVECRSTTTQKLVDVAKCLVGDGAEAPIAKRPCNTTPCVTYYWQLGEFGSCSNQCNGGYQSRTVTCMGSDGAKYKDDFCLTYSYKAPTQAVCNTNPCGNFTWSPEPVWSSCTSSCDSGLQTRAVRCIGPDGNTWPDKVCANTTLALGAKPAEPTQECNTHSCMTTMWDVTPFSKCTRHCGGGRQVRAVTCRKADGTRIPDRVCARLAPKPLETATCNTQVCPTYKWVADEFDDCSVSCGGGVATRDVHCENNFGSRVSNRHCYRLGLERPIPSEACNTKPCGTASSWTIDPWQVCSAECGGGQRVRSVHCRVGNNATDKHCESILPMPTTTEQCNSHPCVTYQYEMSPWSVCSTSCDDYATMQIRNTSASLATQTRQLRCMASDGSYSSLARCAQVLGAAALPETSRLCSTNKTCKRYRWSYGEWTKCSRSCGSKGSQHRAVFCADDKNRKVKGSLCVFSGPKPYAARRCNSYKCVKRYSWEKSPWRACTKACGTTGGVQLRDVKCIDRFSKQVTNQACELTVGPHPRTSRVCNKKPCIGYKWNLTPFSACSKWCGTGSQTRSITCSGSDGRVHKDIYCTMAIGEKADTERICNTVPCVFGKWKSDATWGECTRSCGGGVRLRRVACVGSDGSVLPDSACSEDGPRPRSQSVCNKQKCTSTSWFVGSWSTCSKKCAADGVAGVQTRQVACLASDGVVQADVACAYAGPKAPIEQTCNTIPCDAYVRKYTKWTDCSLSCGGGTQSRKQKCMNTVTNSVAALQTDCAHVPIEPLTQACNTQSCLTYQWKIGAFSPCSAQCGGGEKSRLVTCVGSDGVVVSDEVCLRITAKPDIKRSCHSTPCNSEQLYGWKVGQWSVCDKKCAVDGVAGQQTRQVQCTRKASGKVIEETRCTAKKPPTAQPCATAPCKPVQNNGAAAAGGNGAKGGASGVDGVANGKTSQVAGRGAGRPAPPMKADPSNPQWKIIVPWRDCSKPCDGGEQTREVQCVNNKGTYLPGHACKSPQPQAHRYCNLFTCPPSMYYGPNGPPTSESDIAEAEAAAEGRARRLWELQNPGKRWSRKKHRANLPPKHTLYKHRKRRSKVQGLAEFKEQPHAFHSSNPSIITGSVGSAGHAPKWTHSGLGLMAQEDQRAMFDVTFGVHDPELREAMTAAARSAMKHNDLFAKFDARDHAGQPRSESMIAARQSLRAAMVKARARPGMSDEEDLQGRYDRFDREGRPRSLEEIEQRQLIRSRQRIPRSEQDELKEIYDLYLPNGLPRPEVEIAERRARRFLVAQSAEKADPMSELYDAVDPRTGEKRSESQIKVRQLVRAKRAAASIAKQLAEAKLAQIEARRVQARREEQALQSEPKKNRWSPMTSTGELPPYNEDGSCSDTRGCVLAGADDSSITSSEAIKMLPVVPQFKEKVKDEYEP